MVVRSSVSGRRVSVIAGRASPSATGNVVDPHYRQEEIFTEAFEALIGVAGAVVPSRLVGSGWRTTSSKLLDNVIIGYCRDRPERVSGRVNNPPRVPDSPDDACRRGPLR